MNKYLNYLRTPSIWTFVIGFLINNIIQAVFGEIIPISEGLLHFTVVALVLSCIIIFSSVLKEINAKLIQSRLSVEIFKTTRSPQGDAALYDALIGSLKEAKKSYRALSLFRQTTLQSSPSRERYYKELNNKLLAKHREGKTFTYERFIQVKEVQVGELHSDQVDPLTYSHCKLLARLKENSNLIIRLKQIPNILGTITFAIVDDEKILLFIPTLSGNKLENLQAVHLGIGAFFSDPERTLSDAIKQLFDQLRDFGDTILKVK